MTLLLKAFTTDRKLAFGFDGKSEDPKIIYLVDRLSGHIISSRNRLQ
jgi:hypothetical protein